MVRMVRKEDKRPMAVKVGSETKWMDMHVPAERQPAVFCDGSYKKTADEAAGKVYVYHKDGTRKEVSDAFRG
jgi:CDGSH-type Zn-finger protein